LVWLGGHLGLHWSNETLLPLVAALQTFVLAQGWADHGKEAEKIKAAAAKGE